MDLNQRIEAIINLYDSGRNPNELLHSMLNNNSNFSQAQTQLKNMSNGMPMNQFLMQLAKQNGVTEKNLQGLARILGVK